MCNSRYVNEQLMMLLEKNSFKLDSLYDKNDNKFNIFKFRELTPRFYFGRQQGHTTTINEFVKNNNSDNFLIIVSNMASSQFIEKRSNVSVASIRNINNIRGVVLNYVIIDGSSFLNYTDDDYNKLFTFLRPLSNELTKILCVA